MSTFSRVVRHYQWLSAKRRLEHSRRGRRQSPKQADSGVAEWRVDAVRGATSQILPNVSEPALTGSPVLVGFVAPRFGILATLTGVPRSTNSLHGRALL